MRNGRGEALDRIGAALDEARILLERYGYGGHAERLAKLLRMKESDPGGLLRELSESGSIWGGMGSVVDVALPPSGHPTEPLRDDRGFRRLLITIADELKSLGYMDSRVEDIAEALRRWEAQGL